VLTTTVHSLPKTLKIQTTLTGPNPEGKQIK